MAAAMSVVILMTGSIIEASTRSVFACQRAAYSPLKFVILTCPNPDAPRRVFPASHPPSPDEHFHPPIPLSAGALNCPGHTSSPIDKTKDEVLQNLVLSYLIKTSYGGVHGRPRSTTRATTTATPVREFWLLQARSRLAATPGR